MVIMLIMSKPIVKNGPIHFYPTDERAAHLANVVEYCVQLGERQPITRSQADFLVIDGQVTIEGQPTLKVDHLLGLGTWKVTIRGRNHHVVVHPQNIE